MQPGFDKTEARDMLAICNSFTFIDLYGSDEKIIPAGYIKKYTSGIFGMDNRYQIYVNGEVAVINFRGSTEKQLSWIQNFYASMIPAKGVMTVDGEKFNYCFAKDKEAAVHSGYALGIAFLYKELLFQIDNLNARGIHDIILTGHSQGGALANMFRAYVENLPATALSPENDFKTYAFAAPMIGNKFFSEEYNRRYAADSTSYNIVNSEDLIPTFPLSYNDTNFVQDNVNALIFGKEPFSMKRLIMEGGVKLFDTKINRLMNYVGSSADKKIDKEVAPVQLPPFVADINYFRLGERVMLTGFVYPKILKDSTILQNDSLMRVYPRDENGYFTDERLYQKSPWHYQHKPYNYYVAFLKIYFPEEYAVLKQKYLPENL